MFVGTQKEERLFCFGKYDNALDFNRISFDLETLSFDETRLSVLFWIIFGSRLSHLMEQVWMSFDETSSRESFVFMLFLICWYES